MDNFKVNVYLTHQSICKTLIIIVTSHNFIRKGYLYIVKFVYIFSVKLKHHIKISYLKSYRIVSEKSKNIKKSYQKENFHIAQDLIVTVTEVPHCQF